MAIIFQPLQEPHFPLLLKWLETPHVKACWDQDVEWTPERVREKFGSYVQEYKLEKDAVKKPVQAYVFYIDSQPAGYIQLYKARDFSRDDNTSLSGLPDSLSALNVLIGEEEYLGKGWGSHILTQFLHEYVDPHYDACFVDPDAANIKVMRAYEKTVFKKIRTVKNETVSWMVREKK
ncbi:MAG: GNAT family N-acetyltransferase [Alphaproteobacteria bacterium]|nr:GNAT family N-acetyltransferase [Alphaproteobacteria bacterium]